MERIQSYFFQMAAGKKARNDSLSGCAFRFLGESGGGVSPPGSRKQAFTGKLQCCRKITEKPSSCTILRESAAARSAKSSEKVRGPSNGAHDARNLIKKGLDTMRKYGEKSYHPGTLFMSCQGMPGADNQPMSCAKRMLPAEYPACLHTKSLSP